MRRFLLSLLFIIAAGMLSGSEAQTLYWTQSTFGSARLYRCDVATNSVSSIALDPKSLPEGLDVDLKGKRVVWSELSFGGARILTAALGLQNVSVIDSGGSANRGLTVSNGVLYWASSNLQIGSRILRLATQSGEKDSLQVFVAGSENPRGVAVDSAGGKIYWTDFDLGVIRRADLVSNATIEDLISGLQGPVGIRLDGKGKMFWCEMNANVIRCANVNGSGVVTLVSGLSKPVYLALDTLGGRMYWSESGPPALRSANLDGSGVTSLPVIASGPTGVAVVSAGIVTATAPRTGLPVRTALLGNYPNPFNPATIIDFAVAQTGRVRLSVFDLLGREVSVIVDDVKAPGEYSVRFDGARLASGMYIARLLHSTGQSSQKIVLAK